MESIIESINARIALLKRAIKHAEREKNSFPEGRLRTSKTGGRPRYYIVNEKGDTSGRYVHKNDREAIRPLAQKDYNDHFLKAAKAELKAQENYLEKCKRLNVEEVYNNLSTERKALVTPYILPDDQIAREWQSKTFRSNPYRQDKKIYDTRRGEKVRSKSEAIIADMLFELGIPYRYEYPVRMHNGQVRYPDFTLLKVKTREVIYMEHFGLLDEEGYRKDTLEKLDSYRASGIYPGKNLLFTYETDETPLDIAGIKQMLTEIFACAKSS